jgi:hypothetical protein
MTLDEYLAANDFDFDADPFGHLLNYITAELTTLDARIAVLEGASPGFGSYAESGLRKEGA